MKKTNSPRVKKPKTEPKPARPTNRRPLTIYYPPLPPEVARRREEFLRDSEEIERQLINS